MSSTLDDARDSLIGSTRGWLRYNYGQLPTWFDMLAIGSMAFVLITGLFLATPLAPFFGWLVRRKARRECEREGVDWRAK